jgi:hypothetical protein
MSIFYLGVAMTMPAPTRTRIGASPKGGSGSLLPRPACGGGGGGSFTDHCFHCFRGEMDDAEASSKKKSSVQNSSTTDVADAAETNDATSERRRWLERAPRRLNSEEEEATSVSSASTWRNPERTRRDGLLRIGPVRLDREYNRAASHQSRLHACADPPPRREWPAVGESIRGFAELTGATARTGQRQPPLQLRFTRPSLHLRLRVAQQPTPILLRLLVQQRLRLLKRDHRDIA